MTERLLSACQSGNLSAVKEMLAEGIDPSLPGEDGCSALVLASAQGSGNVVKALLDAGVDANSDQRGITALVAAARNGHLEAVKLLLKYGAEPNLQNDLRVTALSQAAARGHLAVVQALLLSGADPNTADIAGISTLHHAVAVGDLQIVTALLQSGADPNTSLQPRDMLPVHGTTPLMKAATEGRAEVVRCC